MKSDHLQNALGKVDLSLIERPDKPIRKSKPPIRWVAIVAALLAVILSCGVWIGRLASSSTLPHTSTGTTLSTSPQTPNAPLAFTLASPIMPLMAQYPSNPNDHEAYTLWWNDQKVQRTYRGHGKDLTDFFKNATAAILEEAGDENAVYSPLNVYLALSLLAETADGATRQELLTLLGVTSIEALREKTHALWNANYRDDGLVKSVLGNSLWLSEEGEYRQDTVKTLAEQYYASVFKGDFTDPAYTDTMRDWINMMTDGRLKEEVNTLDFDPRSIFSLISTIYFEANWEYFDEKNNKDMTFHAPSGDVTREFMTTKTVLNYYWGEKFSAVLLPFNQGGSMLLILPDEGYTPKDLLTDDEALRFTADPSGFENQKHIIVDLSLVKFDIASNYDLVNDLKQLGLSSCFDPDGADLSSLTDEPCFVSQVKHGCRVAIDEKGVTAAAYTILMLAGTGMPPNDEVTFTLDRPFLFTVLSDDSLPLFTGVVNNP